MKRAGFYLIVALSVLFVAAIAFRGEKAKDDWLASRERQKIENAKLRAENATLRSQAHIWQTTAEAFLRADQRRATATATKIREVRTQPVTPDCAPIVAGRDSIIDSLEAQAGDLRAQVDSSMAHAAELLAGVNRTEAGLVATEKVADAAPVTKSFWAKIKPSISVGVGPGVMYALDDNRLHVGPTATITASWEMF